MIHQLLSTSVITFDNHDWEITGGGIVTMMLYLFIMVLLAILFYKKENILELFSKHLTQGFVVVWMLGFVVYDIGMYPEHNENSINALFALVGVAPMAIIHAFGMFILQSDVSAIHEECHNNAWFMFFFSLAHFLAAFISMVFVIKLFGFNIVASIIRYYKTHFSKKTFDDLYIFWGMNEATYYLADDIIRNGKNVNAKIVIIRVNNSKDNSNKRLEMDRLFNFLSLTNNHLNKLQKLQKAGCLTTSTFGSLTDLQGSENYDILNKELRLSSIVRLIQHTQKTVHLFFLDDDESYNIQAVTNLKKDNVINAFPNDNEDEKNVKFYCRARYNSIHRVIEDEQPHKCIKVDVIDSAHINVELLKRIPELQPVNYVQIKKDATVSSPFNALVVGFGEVGLDSVRFLYEFGAFVKSGSTDKMVLRSDFHCDVVDKNMANLSGQFIANAPAVSVKYEYLDDSIIPDDKPLITLHHMDCQGIKFYKKLEEWVKELNYVVVATENDELNISLAVRLFRMAIRYRNDMKHFCIMVRVQHDENGQIHQIAEHYNRLLQAQNNANDYHDGVIIGEHQNRIKKQDTFMSPIWIFGEEKDAFTYNNIISNDLENDAKQFFNLYSNGEGDWDKRHQELMQVVDCQYHDKDGGTTISTKENAPTYVGMLSLRRKEAQDYANSKHKETKRLLHNKAIKQLGNNSNDDDRERVFNVLAQTEHLRWTASHEILGYKYNTYADKKDEARLLHNCLKPWHELTPEYQEYDKIVVRASLNPDNPSSA